MVPNQSENGKYNLISGRFNKISKIFLCVYALEKQHWRLSASWGLIEGRRGTPWAITAPYRIDGLEEVFLIGYPFMPSGALVSRTDGECNVSHYGCVSN